MTTPGIIICPTTCWGCKFGYCNPEPHPWWDEEDVYYAKEAGSDLPTGYCGCYCSRNAVKALKEEEESEDRTASGHEASEGDAG
jgi:hypothetical protein